MTSPQSKQWKNESPIPEEYRPHMLTGNYAGFMECHIEGDFLLYDYPQQTPIEYQSVGGTFQVIR